jgi:hypothetical protein
MNMSVERRKLKNDKDISEANLNKVLDHCSMTAHYSPHDVLVLTRAFVLEKILQ